MTFHTRELTYDFPEMQPKERLREIILYISDICQDDAWFGKTKLVKLLYMSDFTSFREVGQPITGHKYLKYPNGPFPDHLDTLLDEMEKAGEIAIQRVSYTGYTHHQQRVIPLRLASLNDFTAENIAIVDALVREHRHRNGTEMALLTHGIVWESANMGEAIPYEGSIISDEELTQEDVEHVRELTQKYGIKPTRRSAI